MPTAEEEIQTHSFLQSIQNLLNFLIFCIQMAPTKNLHEVLNLEYF